MKLLKKQFLEQYDDAPAHMNELGAFVYYRTYSRWIESEGRRETWKEAVARAVKYSLSIDMKERRKKGIHRSAHKVRREAEQLFDNIFNLRQFLSGRTHWVGGAESNVAEKFPLGNFNCSYTDINNWDDFLDLFYVLLVGTGGGFKSQKVMARNMSPIRRDFEVTHNDYIQRYPIVKVEKTEIFYMENRTKAVIHIGDAKEGWIDALKYFFQMLTKKEHVGIKKISIHYDYIRPKGSKLKTFGGTASGPEPIREMFEGIEKVLKNTLDPWLDPMECVSEDGLWFQPRPIHMLDIGNLIGNNVVSGGVRRAAEIFLCDADDWESILAKYGINGLWDEYRDGELYRTAEEKQEEVKAKLKEVAGYVPEFMNHMTFRDKNARPLHHRRMSNNSIVFESKPSRAVLDLVITLVQNEGEPGIFNLEAARLRRPNVRGMNPCAEIMLDSKGVCNLTTVNVAAFVYWNKKLGRYMLDEVGLMRAQKLSTRAGVRMTCLDLELPEWDKIHKRDRLIGTSLTGWYDAMDKLGYGDEEETALMRKLSAVCKREAARYSDLLGIGTPLLDTTIKPEGTLSKVAGGVSSGLHRAHADYFIQRIRINALDPLAKAARALGWTVHAEVGTELNGVKLNTQEELATEEAIEAATTLVIDFPVESGAKTTKADVFVEDQFETYFKFQENYTSHNSSNTIHVRPDEWDKVKDIVYTNWDRFIATSFMPFDGGKYTLAPNETITKEQYHELRSKMKPFSPDVLQQYENSYLDKEMAMELAAGCESGVCPVF